MLASVCGNQSDLAAGKLNCTLLMEGVLTLLMLGKCTAKLTDVYLLLWSQGLEALEIFLMAFQCIALKCCKLLSMLLSSSQEQCRSSGECMRNLALSGTRNISVSLLAEFQHAMVVVRLCAPCAALTEAGLSSGCDWAVRVANLHNWSEKQHVNQMVFHSWGNQFFNFNWYLLGAGYVLGMFQMLGIQ